MIAIDNVLGVLMVFSCGAFLPTCASHIECGREECRKECGERSLLNVECAYAREERQLELALFVFLGVVTLIWEAGRTAPSMTPPVRTVVLPPS